VRAPLLRRHRARVDRPGRDQLPAHLPPQPERDALVAAGEVFVLLSVNSLGHCVPDWRAVVVSAIRPKVPRYQGVEAWRVLKACDNDYERKRIELYGELARFAGEFAWSDEVRERVAAVRAAERRN
jgi:hypothetical protein